MAMGKPVIAARVGGVPEIVEDGVTGLLTEIAGLPAALARAMSDPARLAAMGRAARARVETYFSVRAMRTAYGALYARLA
jgi:glycosyltransferase involved in cell wall biosynthesis